MKGLNRRQFVRWTLGGLALSTLEACSTATPLPTPSPLPASTQAHTPLPSLPLLQNDNVPGFYVRYFRPFEAVNPETWSLSVEGLVRAPQTLSLTNVLALPRRAQTSRMKCVECWSAAARWEGFHLSSLIEMVDPLPTAKWVHFRCADGYYESLSIRALLEDRVLFVHHMNDALLPDLYGAPLRLIVPDRYGYKGAKVIVSLEFAEEELVGYWSAVGPYSQEGYIQRGRDHPLDLPGGSYPIEGREIFYPDGIESQDQG
jgi:sulfoxide reductase catalytic subunit YedY